MTLAAGLLVLTSVFGLVANDNPANLQPADRFDALGKDAVCDLLVLGETRPVLLRFRVMVGDRPSRQAWADGVRSYYKRLDANGDGRLSMEEAEKSGLWASLNTPTQPSQGRVRSLTEADTNPKDGVISVEELTEASREVFGPFRLSVETNPGGRTDALFDQLDRDKDGELTRSEMEAIIGSLRRLDRDANELIDVNEVNLSSAARLSSMMRARPTRDTATATVFEMNPDESLMKQARQLIKKYDTGSSRGPGRRDSRLSRDEFAIHEETFSAFDRDHNKTLDAEEVRAYLAGAPRDAIVDIAFSPDASGQAAAAVRDGEGGGSPGVTSRRLSGGLIEIEVGSIRLDIQVDDASSTAEFTRKNFRKLFDSADANQDGYLESGELVQQNGLPSPLANLSKSIDRDGDGKIYPRELDEFLSREATAVQGRLTIAASDEGRALFGMLDLDRDRRLGAREVLGTFDRISECDANRDGRVTPDEVPHHVRLTLDRGDLSFLLQPTTVAGVPVVASSDATLRAARPRSATGPNWFRKMDRNHDGDVSAREFLGTLEQFNRLDKNQDGLLSPDEAETASANGASEIKAPGG